MNKLLRALGVTDIDLPAIEAANLRPGKWVLVVSESLIQSGVIEEIVKTDDGHTFVRLFRPWKLDRAHDIAKMSFYEIEPQSKAKRFSLAHIRALLQGKEHEYRLAVRTPKIADLIDMSFKTVPVTLDMVGTSIAVFESDTCIRRANIFATKDIADTNGSRTVYSLPLYDDFIDGSANPVIVIPTDADA